MKKNYCHDLWQYLTDKGERNRAQIEEDLKITGAPLKNVLYQMKKAGQIIADESATPILFSAGQQPPGQGRPPSSGTPTRGPKKKRGAKKKGSGKKRGRPAGSTRANTAAPTSAARTARACDFLPAITKDFELVVMRPGMTQRFTPEETVALADLFAVHFTTEPARA